MKYVRFMKDTIISYGILEEEKFKLSREIYLMSSK